MEREIEILSATNKIVREKCVIEEMEYSKLPKIYRVAQLNLHWKSKHFIVAAPYG